MPRSPPIVQGETHETGLLQPGHGRFHPRWKIGGYGCQKDDEFNVVVEKLSKKSHMITCLERSVLEND